MLVDTWNGLDGCIVNYNKILLSEHYLAMLVHPVVTFVIRSYIKDDFADFSEKQLAKINLWFLEDR